ncbi:hypothetical protein EJ994_11490 [Maribacter sp. MJ134]|uniref:hypothetical protein n=1 Tax=Maribacter sp. MJ134 TaxID=2496865 RepID=UPI000F83DA6B|nr:hypothetical protein [Maribacter sp. MJ134]AZQ59400.1 hypothetical protein EJ994_11490 [Maribacter sp. MJ134]
MEGNSTWLIQNILPYLGVIGLIWGVWQFFLKRKYEKKDELRIKKTNTYLILQSELDNITSILLKPFINHDSISIGQELNLIRKLQTNRSRGTKEIQQEKQLIEASILNHNEQLVELYKNLKKDLELKINNLFEIDGLRTFGSIVIINHLSKIKSELLSLKYSIENKIIEINSSKEFYIPNEVPSLYLPLMKELAQLTTQIRKEINS